MDAAFHPLNVELLHAVGMVALQSDFGSLFVNIGLLWLALLAAWVAGERAGAGPAAVCVVALFAASAPLGGVAGGTGLNDIGVMAFVLAAVALLDWPDPARSAAPGAAQPVLVGLALGLALGSKLTAPAVVVALAVGWMWLSRGPGWVRRLWLVVGPMLAIGGFWYLRDWVFFGSPLPSLPLSVGGLGLPSVPQPVLVGTEFNVAHYLGDPGVIRHWFVPALHVDFGSAWPVVLALPLAGVVLACRSGRSRADRVLAAAAGFAFVAYLLTPSGAQGAAGQPILFGSNVRYAMPALIVGVIVLIRDPWLARRRTLAVLLLLLEIVTLVPARFWPGDDVLAGLGGALVCGVVFTATYAAWTRGPRVLAAAVVVAMALLGVVGLPAERHYLANRYASTATPTDALFSWSRGVANTHIGAVGFPTLYPFYGASFSNTVRYVGQPAVHHAFNDYTACVPWVRALVAGRYQYVVVMPFANGTGGYARFAAWTREAGANQVLRNSAGWVFRVPGSLSASGCR